MKILKEGKWKLPWIGEFPCPTCEALLQVEESDVKPTYDKGSSYYTTCEACGHEFNVPGGKLPQRLKEQLDAKRKWSSSSDW